MVIKTLKKKESLYYLAGINRPIMPSQVTKLAESIDKMGVIRPIITAKISFITGIEQRYIIDGQHLFNAMIRNDQPILYFDIEINNIQDLVEKIALLNSSSKSWGMVDYMTSWTVIHDDYKKLLKYYNIYDFDLRFLAAILSDTGTTGNGDSAKKIKNGTFKIKDEEKAIDRLNKLTDVLKVISRLNRLQNIYVCSEYIVFLKNNESKYDHNKFLKNLSENIKKFVLATHEQLKLSVMFEDII